MRPFLKWLGGKTRLVPQIQAKLPKRKCLLEPFVGSGAVFLNTDYSFYVLSDINPDLINLYKTLQKYGDEFIDHCKQYFSAEYNNEERYYELRNRFNTTSDVVEKSALFLFANRFGYNGLIRYNRRGELNVPFGRYDKPYFPEEEMRFFAQKAQRAHFVCDDFRVVMKKIKGDSCVYADPPYIPLSATSSFTAYSSGDFGYEDQVDLARLAQEVSARGIPVLISNHAGTVAERLYEGSLLDTIQVRRSVSCQGDNRKKVCEVLALYA